MSDLHNVLTKFNIFDISPSLLFTLCSQIQSIVNLSLQYAKQFL